MNTVVHNHPDVEVSQLVKKIRKAGRDEEELLKLPLREYITHKSARVRKEVVRRVDFNKPENWEQFGLPLIFSEHVEDGLMLLRKLPKAGPLLEGQRSMPEIVELVYSNAIQRSDVSEKILIELIRRSETNSIILNALSSKSVSSDMLNVILSHKFSTGEAIQYQLDNLSLSEADVGSRYLWSDTTVEQVMTSSALTYRALSMIVQNFSVDNEIIRTEGRLIDSLSDSYLKAKRFIIQPQIMKSGNQRYYSVGVASTSLLEISLLVYEKIFKTDADWEEMLESEPTSLQADIVEEYLKEILRLASQYASPLNNVKDKPLPPPPTLSSTALKVLAEYGKRRKSILYRTVQALTHFPEMSEKGNHRNFLHSFSEDELFDFSVKDKFHNFDQCINLAVECCKNDLSDCPTWKALYRWKYFMSAAQRKRLRKFEEECDKFQPFCMAASMSSGVDDETIGQLCNYFSKHENPTLMSEGLKETKLFLKTFYPELVEKFKNSNKQGQV